MKNQGISPILKQPKFEMIDTSNNKFTGTRLAWYFQTMPTVQTLLSACRVEPPAGSGCYSWAKSPDTDWYGTKDMPTAIEAAELGWKDDNAKQIERMQADIASVLHQQRPKPEVRFGVKGSTVNMNRYLQGIPECMISRKRKKLDTQPGKGKCLSILVQGDFNGSIHTKTCLWRGAAIIALVNAFEAAGYRIKIDIIAVGVHNKPSNAWIASECQGGALVQLVTLKDFAAPIDKNRVAFFIASSAFCRRLAFRGCEVVSRSHEARAILGAGYGGAAEPPASFIKRYDLFIGEIQENYANPEEASEQVLSYVEASGVSLNSFNFGM